MIRWKRHGLSSTDRPGTSLIRRVVIGTVLAELVCLAALASLSIAHERRARLRAMSVMLEGRTDSLFGAIQDAEDQADSVQLDARELRIPRGDFFAVYDGSGRQIGISECAPGGLLRLRSPDEPAARTERAGRHSYRVLQRNFMRIIDRDENPATGGLLRPVTIVYATELDHLWHEIFEAIEFYLATSVLLTAATTIALVVFLRSALQPIADLATAAAAVSPRNLSFRAPQSAMTLRELRPLALALTAMLEELRLTFERQHRFLGDAAHELKTAVAVVKSSLQLMLIRPRPAASYAEGLQSAVADNERAERLIARMLLMARLEELPAPARERANPLQVLRRTVDTLSPLLQQASLGLEWILPEADSDGAFLVATSCEYLETVFSNLLVNAIEHSPPGARIIVRVTRTSVGVRVTIADQGEGIPAEAQEHIFERFYRADQSRARQTGGAGLGLSIAKAIVEGAGGTITVASRPGEGTEMTVYLPLLPDQV